MRGKEEEERKKKQDKNIMSASATQDGHNKGFHIAIWHDVLFQSMKTSVQYVFGKLYV